MANITKRKDSYLIRVSCGYDTNGKQIIKCTTWKPPQGMTKRQTERELQKQALEFEERCQNGLVSNNPRLTFAEFVPEYLKIVQARQHKGTKKNIRLNCTQIFNHSAVSIKSGC